MVKSLVFITSAAIILLFACSNITCRSDKNTETHNASVPEPKPPKDAAIAQGQTIQTRFAVPKKHARAEWSSNLFGQYLRQLPLKPAGTLVKYFDATTKANNDVYAAVIDLPIGTKDLHQCADAVMYMRAKFLFDLELYNEIKFRFLGDEKMHFYKDYTADKRNPKVFFKYIQEVWSAANTRSLHAQLKAKNINDAATGDVLIVTGNPYGHAVQIIDECTNAKTGKKLFMLAQSYMPAQEIQVLVNAAHPELVVWYDFTSDEKIYTPEWTFEKDALRAW
jgi:Domain of unknown function (4846)